MNRTAPVAALLALAIVATLARATHADPPPLRSGDVYLTLANDDLNEKRFASELLWVHPLLPWLDGELGGRYQRFDDADWGHGIVGAHAWLPRELGHLTARYEGGLGEGDDTGTYTHHIGDAGYASPLFAERFQLDAGIKFIRVDEVDEDLARVGLTVVPTKWLALKAGYHHSTRATHGAEVWTARGDLTVKKALLFAGYTRSRDTLDLESVGRGRVLNDPTDEYFVGATLPIGLHGLTVSVSRFEGANTRHTISLTWRWSLVTAPWRLSGPFDKPTPGSVLP